MQKLNQDQDIIQINNNAKTFAMAKEQYGFSKRSENPRSCTKPKCQTVYWYGLFCQTNHKKIMMLLLNRNA